MTEINEQCHKYVNYSALTGEIHNPLLYNEPDKQSYDEHVNEALREIRNGQHLRFIRSLYKTKEVCLGAVRYESTHTHELTDFGSVPMGNLDYVVEKMKEIKKDDPYYLRNMENAYLEMKQLERIPGYYGKFKNHQEQLDYYGATDYDDMARKKFEKYYS